MAEELIFARGKKISESRAYSQDGKVSYIRRYSYGAEGLTSEITTVDASGATLRRERIRYEAGLEERIAFNSDGREVERTLSKFDSAGRVVEATLTSLGDETNGQRIQVTVQYDDRGQSLHGQVLANFADGSELRTEVQNHGDQSDIALYMTSPGAAEVQLPSGGTPLTIDRIELRDEKGNWLKKTTFARDTSGTTGETLSEQSREIVYYK